MFKVVEQLFMTPKTIFKCCFTRTKVTFLFVSSDVTVNVGLINDAFSLATVWQRTIIFITAVAVINPHSLGLSFRTVIMHVSVGVHIGHTAVANFYIFYIGPNRKRQMIWFNPPFNLKRKTKIGKVFLNLLDKHFPSHNKLHRLFNRTNVKISYSCMPNMNCYTHMHNHSSKRQT